MRFLSSGAANRPVHAWDALKLASGRHLVLLLQRHNSLIKMAVSKQRDDTGAGGKKPWGMTGWREDYCQVKENGERIRRLRPSGAT